MYKYRMR